MKVFVFLFLFAGASAGFLHSVMTTYTKIEDELAAPIACVLRPLLDEEDANIVAHKGVEIVGGVLLGSLLRRKREVSQRTVKDVLADGAKELQHSLDTYASELQQFNEHIISLEYLKGDVDQFSTDLQTTKPKHEKELDDIVSGVNRTLGCGKTQIPDNIRGCEQFSSAVHKLKQMFTKVHDRLVGGSEGIVGAVYNYTRSLNDTLGYIKDTETGRPATETKVNIHKPVAR